MRKDLEAVLARAERAEKAAEETRELAIMQLAGISTATIQNTETTIKDRIGRDNPYWTVAYGDVCVAVDREMRERARAERAEAACAEMRNANSRTWPWVLGFALEMERKLSKNRHKGDREGWVDESSDWLLGRLKEELSELRKAALNGTDEDVRGEAADVANFAMMIADVSGCLEPFKFDDCGKDYVRREELDLRTAELHAVIAIAKRVEEELKGRLAHTEEALEACERASGFVPGDTSLPQWIENIKADLDDAKADLKAIAEAVGSDDPLSVRGVVEELDAAKAEVERLREEIKTLQVDLSCLRGALSLIAKGKWNVGKPYSVTVTAFAKNALKLVTCSTTPPLATSITNTAP